MKLTESNAEYQTKCCEICGSIIPTRSPSGRKVPYKRYIERRFCSYTCKYKWSSIAQQVDNPVHKDRLYHVWLGMKERCNNPNGNTAKWYHEKGIKVCAEWENDFFAFKKWAIENGYDYSKSRKEQSLDRIDNNKGYSPDNCRFVTHSENCKNTSRNIWLEYNGKKQVLKDWSKETGIPIETLRQRVKKGLPVEAVLSHKQRFYQSNTGVKGISWQEKDQRYLVYADGHKYLGVRKELKDAIELRKRFE